VVAPAATVTEAGTVTTLAPLESVTTAPPAGAAPLKLTVHVELADPITDAGLHDSPCRVLGAVPTLIDAPVPVMLSEPALPDAATVFETPTEVVVAAADNVKLTEATTPLAIGALFIPLSTHVYELAEPAEHESDFPAADAAPSAVAVMLATEEAGYVSVHSNAAGSYPDGDVRDKSEIVVPPGLPVPDDNSNRSD
jgi:hypothetical protein